VCPWLKEKKIKLKDNRLKIREFIVENFLFGSANDLNDDTSFLDEGIVDSTGVLELVTFIENEYSIQVEDEELIPENLDSIDNIVGYLERKMG
jgi:acyl carrier protein